MANMLIFILTCFSLFCSIDSLYYFHHKGKKDSLSIRIVFCLLSFCDKIHAFIQRLRSRRAK